METCNHPRGILEDLLGRGEWRCTLPAGHKGLHAAWKGSDTCAWGDDGFLPEEDDDA